MRCDSTFELDKLNKHSLYLLELAALDVDLRILQVVLEVSSGPFSHFPLLRKSKHTPLEYCSEVLHHVLNGTGFLLDKS